MLEPGLPGQNPGKRRARCCEGRAQESESCRGIRIEIEPKLTRARLNRAQPEGQTSVLVYDEEEEKRKKRKGKLKLESTVLVQQRSTQKQKPRTFFGRSNAESW